jgi:hypothetical protein
MDSGDPRPLVADALHRLDAVPIGCTLADDR